MPIVKIAVLTISGVTLWLAPPFVFSRKIPLHNFMQGVALISSLACCFEARRGALILAKEEDFEAMKARAIDADVADELSTSIYVAEQQRRQEADAILTSFVSEVETDREALEAVYTADFQPANTSDKDARDLELWWKVEAAQIEGKTQTWIIENIFKMKGRKFAEGKAQLAELLRRFGDA